MAGTSVEASVVKSIRILLKGCDEDDSALKDLLAHKVIELEAKQKCWEEEYNYT